MTEPIIPVSATLRIRMSDGSETEIEFYEGGEMTIDVDHADRDPEWDSGNLLATIRPQPASVSVRLDVVYPAISSRPDGVFMTRTIRSAP